MSNAATRTREVPPSPVPETPFTQELTRIREAYERRKIAVPPGRYAPGNACQALALEEIERRIFQLVATLEPRYPGEQRILDIGCGEGYWLRRFIRAGVPPENLAGVDLLSERIAAAQRLCPPSLPLHCCDASHLPFPDESFGLVVSMTVFSSILDAHLRRAVAAEILRVLRPGGAIVWYDFRMNNPRNTDVRRVSRNEIRELFHGCRIKLERVTLAPPLGRMVARSRWVYTRLSRLHILSTHYLGWIQKP